MHASVECYVAVKKNEGVGAPRAQLTEGPTLDFSSGHDLTVREFESRVGLCADSSEPAWGSFPLSLPLSLSLSLSLKNKHFLKRR